MSKIIKNKIAQGITSLFIIIVLLVSILAGSVYYENNITANAVKKNKINENQNLEEKKLSASISGRVTGLERVSGIKNN